MIAVVILNYQNWDSTITCVQSLLSLPDRTRMQIIIVDNASTTPPPDHLLQIIKTFGLILMRNGINVGYAAGNNVGIRCALDRDVYSHILIANSDTEFLPGSIDSMHALFSTSVKIGIVGPLLVGPDDTPHEVAMLRRTGLREKYLFRTPLRHLVPWVRQSYFRSVLPTDQPLRLHSVSGACFMLSSECARVITPLDENTFLYEEELIIGYRMKTCGYETWLEPAALVRHEVGASTTGMRPFSYRCFVESELYYCKHYLGSSIPAVLPLVAFRIAGYLWRAIRSKGYRTDLHEFLAAVIGVVRRRDFPEPND